MAELYDAQRRVLPQLHRLLGVVEAWADAPQGDRDDQPAELGSPGLPGLIDEPAATATSDTRPVATMPGLDRVTAPAPAGHESAWPKSDTAARAGQEPRAGGAGHAAGHAAASAPTAASNPGPALDPAGLARPAGAAVDAGLDLRADGPERDHGVLSAAARAWPAPGDGADTSAADTSATIGPWLPPPASTHARGAEPAAGDHTAGTPAQIAPALAPLSPPAPRPITASDLALSTAAAGARADAALPTAPQPLRSAAHGEVIDIPGANPGAVSDTAAAAMSAAPARTPDPAPAPPVAAPPMAHVHTQAPVAAPSSSSAEAPIHSPASARPPAATEPVLAAAPMPALAATAPTAGRVEPEIAPMPAPRPPGPASWLHPPGVTAAAPQSAPLLAADAPTPWPDPGPLSGARPAVSAVSAVSMNELSAFADPFAQSAFEEELADVLERAAIEAGVDLS
ncbi:hypothetical protein [Haliangium sp.]|uniref:hypothetical protein n=1 Tax=Haliangium sp. TaxID=2663208 RepID=UPI003D0A8B54